MVSLVFLLISAFAISQVQFPDAETFDVGPLTVDLTNNPTVTDVKILPGGTKKGNTYLTTIDLTINGKVERLRGPAFTEDMDREQREKMLDWVIDFYTKEPEEPEIVNIISDVR